MKINNFPENIHVQQIAKHDPLWKQINSNDVFSIYHSRIWKELVEDVFNHTAVYLAVIDSEKLIDVLPLFLIKDKLLGKKLVSTPYEGCNGGFTSNSVEARKMLIEKTLELAYKMNVKYLEIRSSNPIDELQQYGFIEKKPFIISEAPLLSLDENWKNLSPKHRRNVRIAQKKGVSVVQASSCKHMEMFYKILVDHYKNLGLPFFGKKFFRQIWEKLIANNYSCLLLAKFDQKIIGGHLLFFSGENLISKYSAIKRDKEFRKVYASYALFWESIKLGIEKNFTKFNLGITGHHNKGLIDFKSRFGSNTKETHFYYYPVSGNIPDFERYYNSYSLPKKVWKILPETLTSNLGQRVNEWIC